MSLLELFSKRSALSKKTAISLLILIALVFPVFYNNVQAQNDTADYTVLVYMVGSDLESANQLATKDMLEMLDGDIDSNLNMILLTGGANTEDFSTVKLRQVTDDEVVTLEELGSYNMGDPLLLQEFLIYGTQMFPARNYALIFWNHGGGVTGFGQDEMYDDDNLEINELVTALDNAMSETGVTFELIGFDACIMATIEVAYNLRNYANYLVASEEIEPGHGWDWTALVNAISDNPSIDGADLGIIIADSYKTHAEVNSDGNQHKLITLSVIDLNQITPVVQGIDSLSNTISDFDSEGRHLIAISSARAYAEEYGKNEAQKSYFNLIDLADFLILLQFEKPELEIEINSLLDDLSNAIIYSVNGEASPYATGLSIYLPFNDAYFEGYDLIEFSDSWKTFIQNYMENQALDTEAPIFENEGLVENELQAQIISIDVIQNYVSLSRYNEETDREQILGELPVEMDENGNVDFIWDSAWFVLCNELDCSEASFFIDWISETELSITVPVIVNGIDADLLYLLDAEFGEIEFIGYWPGIEGNIAQKELPSLYEGDVINTLMLEYDYKIEDFIYTEDGFDIVVDNEFDLYYMTVPAGEYYATFLALDAAGNWGISDSILVESTGSETYVPAEFDISEEPVGLRENDVPEQTESETPREEQENTIPVTTEDQQTPAPSDSNTQSGGGGCLIATAAFGSELTPQVQFLRNFRDNHILSTAAGSSFMNVFNSWYYSFSPYVANYERQQPWLQQTVKATIYPLLGILHVSEKIYSSIPGEFGALSAGMIASAMIGAVYVSPIAMSIKQIRTSKFNYRIAISLIAAVSFAVVVSILTINPTALMVTTPLFVLAVISIIAILSAKSVIKISKYVSSILEGSKKKKS